MALHAYCIFFGNNSLVLPFSFFFFGYLLLWIVLSKKFYWGPVHLKPSDTTSRTKRKRLCFFYLIVAHFKNLHGLSFSWPVSNKRVARKVKEGSLENSIQSQMSLIYVSPSASSAGESKQTGKEISKHYVCKHVWIYIYVYTNTRW